MTDERRAGVGRILTTTGRAGWERSVHGGDAAEHDGPRHARWSEVRASRGPFRDGGVYELGPGDVPALAIDGNAVLEVRVCGWGMLVCERRQKGQDARSGDEAETAGRRARG